MRLSRAVVLSRRSDPWLLSSYAIFKKAISWATLAIPELGIWIQSGMSPGGGTQKPGQVSCRSVPTRSKTQNWPSIE